MKVQYFNTFGHSKTKNKRKVHTITGLTQETRTSPMWLGRSEQGGKCRLWRGPDVQGSVSQAES